MGIALFTMILFIMMKRKYRLIPFLLSTIILVITAFLLLSNRQYNETSPYDSFTARELTLIRPGDIILRHGKSFLSDVIVNLMDEDIMVSHCAFVVEIDNKPAIIHSVSKSLSGFDGIQAESLSHFLTNSKANSNIVVRFRGTAKEQTEAISKAFDLLQKKLPFDNQYKLTNGENLYCSELLYSILPDRFSKEAVIFKIDELIAFESFIQPEYFDIIIDHRLE